MCNETCGDGLIRGAEACDDGDTLPLDGCSDLCEVEANFVCSGEPSICSVQGGGCGLILDNPSFSPLLVDAQGYGGSGPKQIDAQLRVLDLAGCASPGSAATVRVRIGCAPSEPDANCTRVQSAVVSAQGIADFSAANAIDFFDGENTTMHGIVVHPGTAEVSTTSEIVVVVNLTPPGVVLLRPGVLPDEAVLSLRDVGPGSDWTQNGTTLQGPLEFDVDDAFGNSCADLPLPRARCAFTALYGGVPLNDASGPLQNREISSSGQAMISLADVVWPTSPGTSGADLELTIADDVGNLTTVSVPLNVDADPPLLPDSLSVDRTPYPFTTQRSGQADLSWLAALDDTAGGSSVDRYEIRALCTQRTARALVPGLLSRTCAGGDWSDLATWESRPLVVEITNGAVSYELPQIGIDEDWVLGVRAFDDGDNASAVAEAPLGTRLARSLIGTLPGLGNSPTGVAAIGDVDGDGRDDLLAGTGAGGALLMLGEADPSTLVRPGNPISLSLPVPEAVFFGGSVAAAGDVNADGFADFTVGSPEFFFGGVSFGGNNTTYLYFGGPADTAFERTELATPDVTIVGPVGRSFDSAPARSAPGNFAEIGISFDSFDDLFIAWTDALDGTDASDVYVVLGRATGDWPASIVLTSDPTEACASNVIRIQGSNPPLLGLATRNFGTSGGFVDLDGDAAGFSELVATSGYPGGGTSSTQYIFFGGELASCPTAWTLGTADTFIENLGGNSPAGAGDTAIAVNHLGDEYTAGILREDGIEVFESDASNGVSRLQSVSLGAGISDFEFGTSATFAGNFDQDQAGRVDLVVGAPATQTSGLLGRVYWVGSGTTNPRFAAEPGIWLDYASATSRFGISVVSGFDFNGDGLPDLAVMDQTAETIVLFH